MWDPYRNGDYQQISPATPYYSSPMYFPVPMIYTSSPPAFSHPGPPPWAQQSAFCSDSRSPAYAPESREIQPQTPAPKQRGRRIVIHTSHHYSRHHSRHHGHGHSHAEHGHSHPQPHVSPRAPASVQQVDRAVASRHADSHSRGLPMLSRCTGRKKAICIGINYIGQRNELHGCVNDAKNVHKFLIKHWKFKPGDIFLMTDDSPHTHQQPTKANILDAMRWLVCDACPHDSLVFHYSGHGGQTKDLDGDEADGLDEVIFPVDYKHAGHIVDDEMHRIMVKELPNGCRLTAIFDSCHSGSALDLPYLYHSDGRVKGHSEVTASHLREKATKADVISWSGCTDSQTSADTVEGGAAVGALSYAFMKTLTDNKNQTYQQLLQSLRGILRKNYSQKPQLSSSHRINTNKKFIM